MKLLICDENCIKTYQIPNEVEDSFVINFTVNIDNIEYREILNFKVLDNKWIVYADDKLNLKSQGTGCNKFLLSVNSSFQLKFINMPEYVDAYVLPDFSKFEKYLINNVEKINIGSSKECEICIPSLVNYSVTLTKNGYDLIAEKKDKMSSSYINLKQFSNKKLDAGDVLFVSGIRIIYMKSFLMIDDFGLNIQYNGITKIVENESKINSSLTPVTELEKNVKLYDESNLFTHVPRLKEEILQEEVVFDMPPLNSKVQKMPLFFTIGTSAIMTCTSVINLTSTISSFVKGNISGLNFIAQLLTFGTIFISGIIFPILMDKWEKNNEKTQEKKRQTKYREYIKNKKNEIDKIIQKQSRILEDNNYTLEKIQNNILSNCADIWNRELNDNDFLNIVVGRGNIPAFLSINKVADSFKIENDDLEELVKEVTNKQYELENVPITFSAVENNVVPFVIKSNFYWEYVYSIILQLIYYQSGKDLKIVLVTNEKNEQKWEFMKYLPHLWDSNYDNRFFASNSDDIGNLSMILEKISNDLKSVEEKKSHYLIVTDDYSNARYLTIIDKILNGEEKNFSLLVFEKSIKNLPSKLKKMIQIINEDGIIVEKNQVSNTQLKFKIESLSNIDINKYSKIISNIPLTIKNSTTDIPSSISFLEMYNVGKIEQLNVLSRWNENIPINSLKVPIGMKENNRYVELDLHEKFHGPHGLIAGTTGSGKSEFIITFILSMAINYHPYEVQFVLIDYKGGGLAGAFEKRESGIKIPHLVGTITNLDESEMNRTLVSIKSELTRRQLAFNKAKEELDESTIDIYKYQRLYREGKVKEPMSHLFIIADEFAELKEQKPDFMDELVSAARIGRSLGVHLILATQKPSGVVDDQIWSNSKFKVCLRVQDETDSSEMLKKPDAAYIKEPGRFYLLVGNDELYELGQSGWAGAKYTPSDVILKKVDDDILVLSNLGNVLKVINEEVKKDETIDYGDQLNNIVKSIYNIAKKENLKFSNLWLDNIPEKIIYNDLINKYNIKSQKYFVNPVIGEYDDPKSQKQGYVTLPLIKCGNTAIIGASGSGKTTLLSTMIYSMIINYNALETNIYILDFANAKLKVFSKAPQVGEVLTENESDRFEYFFYMLEAEKEKRAQYYSENYGSFEKDVEKGECPFPTIVVLINQVEIFRENYSSVHDEQFSILVRDCVKYGIVFVVTSTSASLGYLVSNSFSNYIGLNVIDDGDYITIFNQSLAIKKNPGRGIYKFDDNIYEFQVPIIFDDIEYDKNLSYCLEQLDKYLIKKAPKIPVIPEEITYDMIKNKISNLSQIPIGVNVKTAQVGYLNLNQYFTLASSENENNTSVKKFLPLLSKVVSSIENSNLIILNSLKDVELRDVDDAKYYNSNFTEIIKLFNKNIAKYLNEKSDKNIIIFIIGYYELDKYLKAEKEKDESVITVTDLVMNAKKINNYKFIIYDNERNIERMLDSDLETLFRRNTGLWFGKGFESQMTFENLLSYSDSKYLTNNTVTILDKGKANVIKFK